MQKGMTRWGIFEEQCKPSIWFFINIPSGRNSDGNYGILFEKKGNAGEIVGPK